MRIALNSPQRNVLCSKYLLDGCSASQRAVVRSLTRNGHRRQLQGKQLPFTLHRPLPLASICLDWHFNLGQFHPKINFITIRDPNPKFLSSVSHKKETRVFKIRKMAAAFRTWKKGHLLIFGFLHSGSALPPCN